MKKELREVLDAARRRVRERPDYLLSPDVQAELDRLAEERRKLLDIDDRPDIEAGVKRLWGEIRESLRKTKGEP